MNTTTRFGLKNDGITEKLKNTILLLIETSKELQKALLHRRVNTIWEILAEQEQMLHDLEQYTYLYRNLFANTQVTDPQLLDAKEQLRKEMGTLFMISRSNGTICNSFINAIRKVFRSAGKNTETKSKTYEKSGRMRTKQKSLIINQIG